MTMMNTTPYGPLEVHTHYSMLRSTLPPRHLLTLLRKQGQGRFALADLNNLYGMLFCYQLAREQGVDMIVGSTLWDDARRKAVLLVKDSRGYSNLTNLITRRQGEAAFDLLTELQNRLEGLVLITPDRELLRHFNSNDSYVSLEPGSFRR